MPRMKVKTKAEDLARVRNNQRKCRARQKEYIHYLEQKVQHYETAQNAQLSDLQKKIDLLSVENQLLKYFVESITSMADFAFGTPLPLSYEACGAITGSERGFDLLLSPDYGNTSNLMPSAMGGLQGSSSIASNNESLRGGSMTTSNTCLPESLLFDDRFLYPSQLPTRPYNASSSKGVDLSALGCPAIDWNSHNSALIAQPTVSCSEACKLLISYVRRKPDLMSLHLRLRDGYRNSLVPGEGCRVDYHLLLTVLSDAS